MSANQTEPLFDVVIFNMETRKIVSIVGKSMRREGGTHNAELRLETALGRIDLDHYSVEIVPAGKYDVDGVLQESA